MPTWSLKKFVATVAATVAAVATAVVTPHAVAQPEPAPAVEDTFSSLSSAALSTLYPGTNHVPDTNAPATTTVNQGDAFVTDAGLRCTIGYVDKARGVAYTAHHCGKTGYHNSRRVFVYRGGNKVPVGTMVFAHPYLPEVGLLPPDSLAQSPTAKRDIAAIKFDDSVAVGSNSLSGDTRVPLNDVHVGEVACFFGSSSAKTTCGIVSIVNGGQHPEHRIYVALPEQTVTGGDSGGTLFIPGRGSIGIVKGSWIIPDKGAVGVAATGY